MTTEQLTQKVFDHEKMIAAHHEDIKTLFRQQETIESLAESTHEIAESVQKLAVRMDGLDRRVEGFEDEKAKKGFALWQIIMSALISGTGTYIISNILH